jgi:hypothetical protein
VQAFTGDVLDPDTLAPAFDRCYAAYYVAYSIGTDGDFTATEATARSTPWTGARGNRRSH